MLGWPEGGAGARFIQTQAVFDAEEFEQCWPRPRGRHHGEGRHPGGVLPWKALSRPKASAKVHGFLHPARGDRAAGEGRRRGRPEKDRPGHLCEIIRKLKGSKGCAAIHILSGARRTWCRKCWRRRILTEKRYAGKISHQHTAVPPGGRGRQVRRGGLREDCARCHNCVKKACVYDRHRQEMDYIRACTTWTPCFSTAWVFFVRAGLHQGPVAADDQSGVRATGQSLLDAGDHPDHLGAGRNRQDPGLRRATGAGFPAGFDTMWLDMSEIVRPTRMGFTAASTSARRWTSQENPRI